MNQGSTRRTIIRLGILVFAIFGLYLIWQQLLSRPFTKVYVPDGATSVVITSRKDASQTTSVSHTKTIRLRTGSYNVISYDHNHAVSYADATVHIGFNQKINAAVQHPSSTLTVVMHRHADIVAPLGKGYLYVDNATRGVFYTDTAGTSDISSSFLLSQTSPEDPNFTGTYATVIAMQPLGDGSVVVTTTMGVYKVRSPQDITRFSSYTKDFLYFTSSSVDATMQRVYLLAANRHEIYYYDLTKPEQGPQMLAKAPQDINRVNAGGGKVVVYFDDVPSLEPKVLAAYAINHQLSPLLIDGMTGKTLHTYNDWQGTTLAVVSPDGKYLAMKLKFATTMRIYNLQSGKDVTIPASDTNALIWIGDSIYYERGNSLWSADATKGNTIRLIGSPDKLIIRLQSDGNRMLATTNDFYIFDITGSASTNNTNATALAALKLQTADYFIAFTTNGQATHFDIETSGDIAAGLDDTAQAASKAAEYQKGQVVIQNYLNQPGTSVTQQDTSLSAPYETAAIPNDEGGNSSVQ